MRYLYLNTFKSIIRKKTFFIGIIVLMTLSSILFSLLFNVSLNLKNSFRDYKETQNIQDFSFLAQADLSKKDIENFYANNPDVQPKQKARIDAYYNLIDDPSVSNAKRENVKEDAMAVMVNYSDVLGFRKASADALAKKYNFTYEPSYQKDVVENIDGMQHAFRFIPYYSNNKINLPYVIQGKLPAAPGEVDIYPDYLKANHLSIGSDITIKDNTYKIVGTFLEPNAIFPKIDLSSIFFDSTKQTLVLTYPDDYNNIKNVNAESSFVAVFNNKSTDVMKAVRDISNDKQSSYTLNYLEDLSVGGGLYTMVNAFDSTSKGILIAFTLISMLIVSLVVRKKIREDRKKLGILKSLGYSDLSISFSYMIYGVIAGISAIIGFSTMILLKDFVLKKVKGYFCLPLLNGQVEFNLFIISFLVLYVSISTISILIAYHTIKEKPIDLLNPIENDNISIITKFINRITAKSNFQNRFRYTLASRSLSKLVSIVLLTVLCGVLITLVSIASNFFPALEKNFANYQYQYQVNYNTNLEEFDPGNGLQPGDTVMVDVKGTIDEVNGIATLNNKASDGEFLHIMGIDKSNTSYPIYDKNGNIIHTTKEGAIVTGSFLRQFNAKVGDIITITPKSKYDYRFQIPIIGLSSNFTDGPGVFIDRVFLNEKVGSTDTSYNVRLTSSKTGTDLGTLIGDGKIVSVTSMADLKESYSKMSSIANYLVVLLDIFMTLLTMTLIALLSNLVIEENASTISLLKVMGFHRKERDGMVLNIYTPFIILAILIAEPLAVCIIKVVFYIVFGGSNVAFPIELTVLQMLLSAFVIFVGYALSLSLNRKGLNKIPISLALKRE